MKVDSAFISLFAFAHKLSQSFLSERARSGSEEAGTLKLHRSEKGNKQGLK
jgi:hypothetical protein